MTPAQLARVEAMARGEGRIPGPDDDCAALTALLAERTVLRTALRMIILERDHNSVILARRALGETFACPPGETA